MSVKSVYNFVPAPKEDEVFKPDWAKQVSQDIPFSDGESGEIEFTITAETPIFIRNGHSADNESIEFSHYFDSDGNKKYFIPATSLKGMFRNVLEIMSFSRLKTEDDIFGFRNLNHKDYGDAVMKNREIKTGWLIKENEQWIIQECEHKRISIGDIESKFEIELKGKSAVEKYEAYKRDDSFTVYYQKDLGRKIRDRRTNNERFIKTGELFQFKNNGGKTFKGKLVFYGAMNNKKYEYVFGEGNREFQISNDLMNRFIEIETKKENDDKQESSLFHYLKNKGLKIPVFFSAKGNEIEHFGFSRLYKMPNVHRISELEPIAGYPKKYDLAKADLAEVIFGSTDLTNNKNKKESLKGRVYFGNAHCTKAIEHKGKPIKVVLNSPKASYYPFYLKGEKTYLDADAELSGFKQYPVHTDTKNSVLNEENKNLESEFIPLRENSVFTGKVRFHNLKKEEIGALLSAITFHGNTEKFSHNIGGAKPLGYGKIKVKVESISNLQNTKNEYLYAYEELMNKHIEKLKLNKNSWFETEQMQQLLAMSQSNISTCQNKNLIYPEIEFQNNYGKPTNEFSNYNSLPDFGEGITIDSIALKDEGLMMSMTQDQEELDLSEFKRFQDLSKYLNEELNKLIRFSEINKQNITRQIKFIYNNHNASRRKLQKDYDWENNILNWIGQYEAKQLREKLKKE